MTHRLLAVGAVQRALTAVFNPSTRHRHGFLFRLSSLRRVAESSSYSHFFSSSSASSSPSEVDASDAETITSSSVPPHASVVICGGGIVGVAVAHRLAEAGLTDVVLLEQGRWVNLGLDDQNGINILSSAKSGPRTAYHFHANVCATTQHTFECPTERSKFCCDVAQTFA